MLDVLSWRSLKARGSTMRDCCSLRVLSALDFLAATLLNVIELGK